MNTDDDGMNGINTINWIIICIATLWVLAAIMEFRKGCISQGLAFVFYALGALTLELAPVLGIPTGSNSSTSGVPRRVAKHGPRAKGSGQKQM